MRKLLLAAVALAAALPGRADAQDWYKQWYWGGSYSISVPVEKTKDFTDETSYLGFALEGRKVVNDRWTVGTHLGWLVFDSETSESVTSGNTTITGKQFRYLNVFPLLVNAHFYLGESGRVRPYGGVNLGAYVIERRVEISLVALEDTEWHFGLAPEAGLILPLKYNVRGLVNAKYNLAFATDEQPEQSYWSFTIGFGSF